MVETSSQPSSDAAQKLRLETQLCFGLYAASHLMTKAYRPYLKELGLTYPQYLVLLALFENNCQTVSALGDALMLDSGTLSPLLKRLEAAGLVDKARHPGDERLVEVSLTAKGQNLQSGASMTRQEIVRMLGMSDAQIAVMRRDLNGLMLALDEEAAQRMMASSRQDADAMAE